MNFEQAFDILQVGANVTVSDGSPMPPVGEPASQLHIARWRTSNFTGVLVEKNDLNKSLAFKVTREGEDYSVYVIYSTQNVTLEPVAPSATVAEKVALEKLEDEAEAASTKTIRRLRRQLAVDRAWNEVQRLKLANATNTIPADTLERQKQYPTIMALAHITGAAPLAVATSIENKLWDLVRKNALWEAKLLVAEDQIRNATTPEQKLAIASSIVWEE